MRRPIALCTCILALITGAWFGLAFPIFATQQAPAFTEDQATKAATGTAWRFYDAIDLLLRTGDDSDLRAVLAPGFVDHVDAPGDLPGRDALVTYLASLRETHPTLRLTPEEIVAQGDRVVVRLAPIDTNGAILGIPLAGKETWPPVDVVRVQGDLVVERWGDPAGYGPATTLFAESLNILDPGDLVTSLRRVTVPYSAAGASAPWPGPAVIVVETGTIEVQVQRNGPSEQTASATPDVPPAGQTVTLAASQVYAVRAGTTVTIANRDAAPAVLLVLSLDRPPGYPESRERAADAYGDSFFGLTSEDFTGAMSVPFNQGHLAVALARVGLAPGERLAPHSVDGLEIVIAETGTATATVSTDSGYAWLRDPEGWTKAIEGSAQVAQGFSLATKTGATTSYENETAEAVILLLLTMTPG